MLLQRIFASVLLLACLSLVAMAWPYQAPFSYEPIGPRAFPLLMLGLMGLALVYMVYRPSPIKHGARCVHGRGARGEWARPVTPREQRTATHGGRRGSPQTLSRSPRS